MFTSVTGYHKYKYDRFYDADGTAQHLANARQPEKYDQFSQELRVTSPEEKALAYMGGVYFQKDSIDIDQEYTYQFLTANLRTNPRFAPLLPFLPLGQANNFSVPVETYSAFGSLTWNLSDSLKISGGLRGSRVKKGFSRNSYFANATTDFGGLVQLPASLVPLADTVGLGRTGTVRGLKRTDDAWMPSAQVQYKIDPDRMVYLSYARGFKAGGFNGLDTTTNDPASLGYAPEYVNAYELGLKSEWFDKRVVLNVTLFRSDYRNLQVAVNQFLPSGSLVSLVRNAAAARSEGVEFEGKWAVNRHFRLSVDATYLNSKFRDYRNAGATDLQILGGQRTQDLSGHYTPYAPRWTGRVAGTYSTPVLDNYKLTLGVNANFSSKYYQSDSDERNQYQFSYWRANAQISLATEDGRWEIGLIGNNLNDATVLVYANNLGNSLGSTRKAKAQPRSGAIQLRFNW